MSDNSMSQPQSVASSARITISSPALKQNQRGSGRIIRGILLNKETRQNQASVHQAEQQLHNLNLDKDRRPPRPPNFQSDSKDANGVPDEKAVNDLHGFREKQERRTRNKDRPDRGVWTLRRSDGSYASDESFSSSGSQPSLSVGDSSEGLATIFTDLCCFLCVYAETIHCYFALWNLYLRFGKKKLILLKLLENSLELYLFLCFSLKRLFSCLYRGPWGC